MKSKHHDWCLDIQRLLSLTTFRITHKNMLIHKKRRKGKGRTISIIFSEMFYEETNKYITERSLLNANDIHKILFALSARLLAGELDERAKNLDYSCERRIIRTFYRKMLPQLRAVKRLESCRSKLVKEDTQLRAITRSKDTACV